MREINKFAREANVFRTGLSPGSLEAPHRACQCGYRGSVFREFLTRNFLVKSLALPLKGPSRLVHRPFGMPGQVRYGVDRSALLNIAGNVAGNEYLRLLPMVAVG